MKSLQLANKNSKRYLTKKLIKKKSQKTKIDYSSSGGPFFLYCSLVMLLLHSSHSSHQPSFKTSATRPPPEAPSPPYPLLMTIQCYKKKRTDKD